MKTVVSRDNAHFKALLRLAHSGRERRKTGQTLLDGVHLAEAWGAAGGSARAYLVSAAGLARREIADFIAARPEVPATCFGDSLFAELSPVDTPSGLLTLVDTPPAPGAPRPDLDSVILDGVQDPGNVGSILRSAAAAGFSQVLTSRDCAHVWSPRTLRAGMGAHFALAIHEAADLAGFLATYAGTSVVTDVRATASVFTAPLAAPVAWIFGSEGQGVRPELAAAARLHVAIPMPGPVESINVAAAAAICLFERVRRFR